MTFLEYAKQYHNFDVFLVLVDDAGYSDDEIMEKFQVSKQTIYNARQRMDPVIKALAEAEPYRRDMRNKDVQAIIEAFSEAFGTTATSAYDRYAAKRLHVKYGSESVVKLINALASKSSDQYAPTVNSVSQLEKKLPQVVKFVQSAGLGSKVIEL